MALTKKIVEDKIEVIGDYKSIQIREATVISEDDVELSRKFHRRVIQCCRKEGDTWSDYDTSSESAEVQAIAAAVWTNTVKTNYKKAVDAAPSLPLNTDGD
tara:strand:- start:1334 stop:1636 length:303 start_codon:yes stop_codon:yes gene_type:complete